MQPVIEVRFAGNSDASLASSAQRWVDRLECMGLAIDYASVAVAAHRRATVVDLFLRLGDGRYAFVSTAHTDPYVAIADAFRNSRRMLVSPRVNGPSPSLATPVAAG